MTPLEIVTATYAAMAAKDLAAVSALCHPDVVLTQDPALPWGGRHVGSDGVAEFAIALIGAIDSAVTTLALYEAGERVVQYGRTAGIANASGKSFDIPECHIWTVTEGKVSEVSFFIASAAMLEALKVG